MSTPIHYAIPHVTMDPSCYLRSSWRDAVGKPLTNTRITHYERLGFYGKEAQVRATQRLGVRPCKCGSRKTSFMRYSYLPHAMWCCEVCRINYRNDFEKQERIEKEMRDKVRQANKSLKAEAEARRALRREQLSQVFE